MKLPTLSRSWPATEPWAPTAGASRAPGRIVPAACATTTTCDGIKEAYNTLGQRCEKNYGKIRHNLAGLSCEELRAAYNARLEVLKVFRLANSCNGLNDCGKSLLGQESGHITAINQVSQAMTNQGCSDVPPTVSRSDLSSISAKKTQCS